MEAFCSPDKLLILLWKIELPFCELDDIFERFSTSTSWIPPLFFMKLLTCPFSTKRKEVGRFAPESPGSLLPPHSTLHPLLPHLHVIRRIFVSPLRGKPLHVICQWRRWLWSTESCFPEENLLYFPLSEIGLQGDSKCLEFRRWCVSSLTLTSFLE